MGMLDRYKKSGGFVQLLNLIETCGPVKQEKFLNIIHQEDPNWATAIQQKMLSVDRILSWPDETLAEVFGRIQDLTLATALFGLGEDVKKRLFAYFSHAQQRRITDIMDEKKPTESEIAGTYVKILEEVRHLVKEGYLKFEKFDPTLAVDEDIEELLAKGTSFGPAYQPTTSDAPADTGEAPATSPVTSPAPEAPASGTNPTLAAEITTMKRKIQVLSSENSQLKKELGVLRGKLEQIKKIA